MDIPINGNYYDLFLQSEDPHAKKIIEALNKTLEKFNSTKDTVKEAILRLFVLASETNFISTDKETNTLLKVLDEFKKELNMSAIFDRRYIFVYGTLKTGQIRNFVLDNQRFVKKVKTRPLYGLYSNGDFPCLVDDGKSIEGELWEVDENCLAKLDQIEGHPVLFKRGQIHLADDNFYTEAYFWNQEIEEGMIEIEKWN